MRLTYLCMLFVLGLSVARGAFTPLGSSGDDPLNFGSFSGPVLESITLNGSTYSTEQLVQIELTAFRGQSGSVLLQVNGGEENPTAQQRRDFLETDWRGDTGIINPSVNNNSVGATFERPVRNIAGPDMFLYEINTSGADAFQIRINGTQLTVDGGDYGDSGVDTVDANVLTLSGTPTDLTDLLTNSASVTSSDISQNIVGVGIDFSDFGVALGDTVTNFSFNSASSSSTFDPVIIGAIPEPRTYVLLAGLLALGWAVCRRHRS